MSGSRSSTPVAWCIRQSRTRAKAVMPNPMTMAVRTSAWGSGSGWGGARAAAPSATMGTPRADRPAAVKISRLMALPSRAMPSTSRTGLRRRSR